MCGCCVCSRSRGLLVLTGTLITRRSGLLRLLLVGRLLRGCLVCLVCRFWVPVVVVVVVLVLVLVMAVLERVVLEVMVAPEEPAVLEVMVGMAATAITEVTAAMEAMVLVPAATTQAQHPQPASPP